MIVTAFENPDPLVGFKVLRVFGKRHPVLISQNDFGDIWTPGWNQAICGPSGETVPHPLTTVPDPACLCGFHVWASLELALDHQCTHQSFSGPTVIAMIIGAGNMEIHDGEGWRAQYAKIVGLVQHLPATPVAHQRFGSRFRSKSLPTKVSLVQDHRLSELASIYSALIVPSQQAIPIATEFGELIPALPLMQWIEPLLLPSSPETEKSSWGSHLASFGLLIILIAFGLLSELPALAVGITCLVGAAICLLGLALLAYSALRHFLQNPFGKGFSLKSPLG